MPQRNNNYDKKHLRNIAAICTRIDRIFKKAAEEAALIGVSIKDAPGDRIFTFDDYPQTRKQVDRLVEALQASLETAVVNGIRGAWELSNDKNDALVRRVFGSKAEDLPEAQRRRYFGNNAQALEAFLARKAQGLGLSDRVWRYTDAFKSEIEMGIDLGLRSGQSAAAMTRDLRLYLRHPDKLFRRVRDQHGLLQLSKAAKGFHPGRGVYRSSYMNARRLAATETNIAYRTADHLRWQKMDFVVGIEIVLSNNHTIRLQPGEKASDLPGQMRADGTPKANAVRTLTDICDTLAGRYPKDFKFTGWHPHCRCHAVTILKTGEEMARDTQRILEGKQPLADSANAVTDTPEAFKDWVENNRDRIAASHSLPYFVKDNTKYIGIPTAQAHAPLTPIEAAAARHAKRTAAQIQDIKRRYWERFEPDYLTDEQKLANIEAYLQIEKDLGIKRGRPMSHEQANEMHGNPHYGESKGYGVNCQTCVVAYELRLRGFDVSALPNTAGSALEKLSRATYTAWQGVEKADIPVFARRVLDKHGRIKQPPIKWKEVSAAMAGTGRYHIAWRWKRKRSGHIITAERLPDGRVRFYDPQNGESGVFARYKPDIAGSVEVYRVDTLAPNANVIKDVLTKGEAKAAAGTAAQGGISGQSSYRKQYKDRAVKAFENKAADVHMPNGTTAKLIFVNGRTIGRRFFNETFAKNLHNSELQLVMEFAAEVDIWIKNGQMLRKEKGRHHACDFNVYTVEYKGRTIIYKTMDLPGEPIYTMQLQK